MIITNERVALVGYFITSYPTRAHGIIVKYFRAKWRLLFIYINLSLHSISDAVFMKEGYWSKRVDVQRAAVKSSELNIHLISQEYGITTHDIIIHNKTGPSN